ncbi:NAD(P)-binding protein [Ganoderma leucocontextum]|nr:NAD(P)-binding protein [Ganoderma leucocontextum]
MPGIKDAKCVLVIGATAGLGRSLAFAIHDLETKPTVIVAGRRQERLDELAAKGERIKTTRVDINTHHDDLKLFVQDILSKYPELDAIMLSSGIQHIFDFRKPETIDFKLFDDEFNTNYVSIIKLIVLFLPHFLKRGSDGRPSFIIPITSMLGLIPKVEVPNYSATKAALHSLDMSLRAQLKGTNVYVMEILPPLVESELHDHQGTAPALSKLWMPLDQFTKLTMEGLIRGDPDIAVGFAATHFEKYEKGKREQVEQNLGKIPSNN